jgi:hypothetical protein
MTVAIALVSCGGGAGDGVGGGLEPGNPLQPTPVKPGSHGYFQTLSARPELTAAYSLRDQAQLDQYADGRPPSSSITFDPENDHYPRAQDAAKVVVGANMATIKQVRLPIGTGAGTTLITWDAWWGPEFRSDRGGMLTQKTFQIASHLDNSERWLEIRNNFNQASGSNIAAIDMRNYAHAVGPSTFNGPNGGTGPQRAQFQIAPATWTRYWVLVEILPDAIDRVSLRVADENRGPVVLLDRVEIESAGTLTNLWLEYNSSSDRMGGPLVGYLRNVVILHDVASPATLYQRPVR